MGYNTNILFGFFELELDIYFKFYTTFSPARVKVVFILLIFNLTTRSNTSCVKVIL